MKSYRVFSLLFITFISLAFFSFSLIQLQFWGAEKETQQRLETAIFEDLNRYCWTAAASAPPTTNGSVTDTTNNAADNDNSGNNSNNTANSSTSLGPPVINNGDGQVVYLSLYISSPSSLSLIFHSHNEPQRASESSNIRKKLNACAIISDRQQQNTIRSIILLAWPQKVKKKKKSLDLGIKRRGFSDADWRGRRTMTNNIIFLCIFSTPARKFMIEANFVPTMLLLFGCCSSCCLFEDDFENWFSFSFFSFFFVFFHSIISRRPSHPSLWCDSCVHTQKNPYAVILDSFHLAWTWFVGAALLLFFVTRRFTR